VITGLPLPDLPVVSINFSAGYCPRVDSN